MSDQEHSDLGLTFAKVIGLWIASFFALDFHTVASNFLVTLSILYLIWKWWRDYKREKAK